jgi:hypothetical protein
MKNIRENIYVLFGYELFVGAIAFGAILLLGNRGLAALSMMALLPILYWKRHIDEREYQLFYKVGHYTSIFVFVAMILFYMLRPSIFCPGVLCISYFTIHGLAGLLVFSRG